MNKKIFYFVCLLIYITSACGQSLKIATINLWHYPNEFSKRLNSFLLEDHNFNIDIYAFQEAWTIGNKSIYKMFLKKKGYYDCYFRTNRFPFFEEGLAVVSKYPIINCQSYELPMLRSTKRRKIIIAEVLTNLGKIIIVNVHLSPFENNHNERVAQIQNVADRVADLVSREKTIIVGDFNEPYSNTFFQELFDLGFINVIDENTCTYCKNNPYSDKLYDSSLDNIFYNNTKFKLKASKIIFDHNAVSDHYGLFLEVSNF
ncbi:MAG: hypothetical protein A2202_02025 [Bdellovibrionales bacterium RIFOXYA1_FULL_36_14]|nr:MAG: hypothetical protein A2202_02025 [Bdellovibrionales bacterium RIFOXYA1_FULL_36_14]